MNKEVIIELENLMNIFPGSFINRNMELILIPKTNTYFVVKDCYDKRDIISKLLMWCSRDVSKGQPFRSQKRNLLYRELNKRALNYYLGMLFTDEDWILIYQKLGNGINPELTYAFIDSGFKLEVLGGRR